MKDFLGIGYLNKGIKTRYGYMQTGTFCIIPHAESFGYRIYFPKQNIKGVICQKDNLRIVTKFTLSHLLKNKYLVKNIVLKSKLMKDLIKEIK